jgi:hypothetical protein
MKILGGVVSWAIKNGRALLAPAERKPATVFLTFRGAMQAFLNGMVDGFEGGLFYFECSRAFFLDPSISGESSDLLKELRKSHPDRAMQAYRLLKEAVARAQLRGRAVWPTEYQTVGQLNALLEQNELPKYPDDDAIRIWEHSEVSDWFESNCPEKVRAIWSGTTEAPIQRGPVTDNGCTTLIRHGIVIAVTGRDGCYCVSFSNVSESADNSVRVESVSGIPSRKEALRQGIDIVDSHQLRFVERIGSYRLSVRRSWGGGWVYLLKNEGKAIPSAASFVQKEETIAQGRIRGREEDERFRREVEEDIARARAANR